MTQDAAECRGCGRTLQGSAYHTGKPAWIKDSRRHGLIRAPRCHYGGHVCSESCDRRACLDLERSMPGHGSGQSRLSGNFYREIAAKWEDLRREYPGADI